MPPKKKRRVGSDKPTKETKQGKIWQFLSTRQYGTLIVNESCFIVAVELLTALDRGLRWWLAVFSLQILSYYHYIVISLYVYMYATDTTIYTIGNTTDEVDIAL